MATDTPFRFDALDHEYIDLDTGAVLPHITGMLEADGLIDDRWYTEASARRGTDVHRLTADYDLGVFGDDLSSISHAPHFGYLQAHVAAMKILRPTWEGIEEPRVCSRPRFGGRIDRDGQVYGALSICELKTGDHTDAHQIQTALQAILLVDGTAMPAESVKRYCLYLKVDGKFKLEEHVKRADFDRARTILRRFTR